MSAACINKGFSCWRHNDKHFKLDPDVMDRLIDRAEQGHRTVLIKSMPVTIPDSMRGRGLGARGKPVTHRTGPLCTPAFAMTDQKSQGKQFSKVLLNLKGVHGTSTETKPSFMSLYVQLSRAEKWEGIFLFREPARSDFIEPKNVLDISMRTAVLKLEKIGEDTRERFIRTNQDEAWFPAWHAMLETFPTGAGADIEEDESLWCD